ncbi:Uncharacterised protein [uncultured archaeon]|nr:Uncharacterised protein [uncultured archaeon]
MVSLTIGTKRGWIRILEAVIAILLLSGVLIYVTVKNQVNVQSEELAKTVSDLENTILESIASSSSLRNATLNENYTALEEFVSSNLVDPDFNKGYSFNYSLGICDVQVSVCPPTAPFSESSITTTSSVFVEERIISSTLQNYNPKILRLYLWTS